MRVRGAKLEIRKKLRRESAEKNGSYVRTVLVSVGWSTAADRWLEDEEKKELRERRRGVNGVEIVRMIALTPSVAKNGVPGSGSVSD
jgi:hypothetical protein